MTITKYKRSLQDDIGYWLNRLRMRVHTAFLTKLATENITLPEWHVLISLYNGDASNVVELAKFIEVDKGAISRVLDKLEENELVVRKPGKNRRTSLIVLTPKGAALSPKLGQLAEENEAMFFSSLSSSEKKQLRLILTKLLKHAGVETLGGWLAK